MSAKEIKVKIKTEDKKFQQCFLVYDDFMVSETDSTIEKCIQELKGSIHGSLEDPEVEIIIRMSI